MRRRTTTVCPERLQAYRAQPASLEALEEFVSMETWLCSDPARRLSLHELELAEQERGRQLLRLLLQAHLDSRGDGDVGDAIEVFEPSAPRTGVLYTHKRTYARYIITIFGEIEIERLGYGLRGKRSIHPLDEQLQLPARSYSYTIQKRLVKHSLQGTFDAAIDAVFEPTGVCVPKRTAEQILMEASVDFDSFYATRKGASDQYRPVLVGCIDTKGIPMIKSELAENPVRRKKGQKAQKKKMATVAAVYGHWGPRKTPEQVIESLFNPSDQPKDPPNPLFMPHRKRVWASLVSGKDPFITDVHQEMMRRDPLQLMTHVVVTDGERALQHRVVRIMPNAILILDLFHVLEKLWDAGHALYGEESPKAKKFVRDRALRILQGDVSQVVKGLRQTVTKRRLTGHKRKALSDAANYLYKNRSYMRYHEYLDRGFPIASGAVEGACKHLIKDRMERSGMRWSANMAEAMLKLRATFLSGDFHEYWRYHVSCDQKRIYPNRWKPLQPVVEK
jgi:hypothetical protein